MTRALVLGGGGPLGVGWQAGLLSALTEASVRVGDADFIVGTSAGSIVGAQISSGLPLSDLLVPIGQPAPWRVGETGKSVDLAQMIATLDPANMAPEADWIAYFDFLGDRDWPAPFRCTSYSITSGSFSLWDRASGVDLQRAVASSCTVPGLVAPVTINGESWIDGGARDALNADLAIGHEVVVAVSCMALAPPKGATPEILAGLLPGIGQRIGDLRASGAVVEVIEPSAEFGELSGWGRYLMDVSRTGAAFEAGLRQGDAEVERIRALWTASGRSAS
jgi:NTE family protein